MRMPVPSSMVASANGEHEAGRWGVTEIARQSFLCDDNGNNDSRDTAVSFLTYGGVTLHLIQQAEGSPISCLPPPLPPPPPPPSPPPPPPTKTLDFDDINITLGDIHVQSRRYLRLHVSANGGITLYSSKMR